MRTTVASLASLVALGALILPAQAQNVVNSAESQQIYWVYTATVNTGRLADFKQLVSEVVAHTAQEPRTLAYQYNLSPDEKSIDIVERYADSDAAITHVKGFIASFGKRFGEDVTGTHFTVYGPASDEAKKLLGSPITVFMLPIDGFTR
jgi:quinol monooxygenase YgiN